MGVDANVFAKKARRRVDVDRERNIHAYWDHFEGDALEELEGVWDRLKDEGNPTVTSTELILYLEANMEAWDKYTEEEGEGARRKWWCEVAKKFAEAHPDDVFFVINDHEAVRYPDAGVPYPEYYDVTDIYEEWKP